MRLINNRFKGNGSPHQAHPNIIRSRNKLTGAVFQRRRNMSKNNTDGLLRYLRSGMQRQVAKSVRMRASERALPCLDWVFVPCVYAAPIRV